VTALTYVLGSVVTGSAAAALGILVTRAVLERPVPGGGSR
jgi:hypothetical protein